MPKDNEPKPKQYSLKPIELQMIGVVNEQHQAMLSNMLSFIAIDRLGYHVTERTQYRIDEKGNLFIWEVPDMDKPPVDVAGGDETIVASPVAKPQADVVGGDEPSTADAIKGSK